MTTIAKPSEGLRAQYRKALDNDGMIDGAEAKALLKEAKGKGDKQWLADHLHSDAYDPAARTAVEKAVAGRVKDPSGLAGQKLGELRGADPRFGVAVTIKRELGPKEGYLDENQARAAARLSGAHAAIIKDSKGRWHAVELEGPNATTFQEAKGFSPQDNPKFRGIELVTPLDLEYRKALQDKFSAALKAYSEAKGADREPLLKAAEEAALDVASYTLGVPRDRLHISYEEKDTVPGKINIDFEMTASGTAGPKVGDDVRAHIPEDHHSDAGTPTMTLWARTMTDPRAFLETYMHESTHIAHEKRAIELLGKWRDSGSKDSFASWLGKERKAGRVDLTDSELGVTLSFHRDKAGEKGVREAVPGLNTTEAIARVEAFGVSAGRRDAFDDKQAAPFKQISDLGKWEPRDADVKTNIKQRLRDIYDALPPAGREAMKQWLDTKPYAGTWMSDFKL